MIYFITGNKNKVAEVQAMLPNIEQLDIDLPEIQDIDAKKIVREKLREAINHAKGEFIIEDTSFYLECLHGLPGPLIKWFLQTIGPDGLARIADTSGNKRAEARTIIGYARNHDEIYFFEGAIAGTVVTPRGENGFGWDVVFMPDGYQKTFAEMGREEKNNISMRRIALDKLREFLEQ
jgi:non-canonical purine NTP pyrophosphatase (RdgB/HAM1 family)